MQQNRRGPKLPPAKSPAEFTEEFRDKQQREALRAIERQMKWRRELVSQYTAELHELGNMRAEYLRRREVSGYQAESRQAAEFDADRTQPFSAALAE